MERADIDKLLSSVSTFSSVFEESSLKDRWQTEQQSLRDKEISELLRLYVDSYRNKVKSNLRYRLGIVIVCMTILLAIVICCIYVTVKTIPIENNAVSGIVALITAYGSVIGVFMGVIQIITKYVFPENEEQYITEIVKAIQENDLQHKKVNIEAERKKSHI